MVVGTVVLVSALHVALDSHQRVSFPAPTVWTTLVAAVRVSVLLTGRPLRLLFCS